ncbi:hypothetical protein RUM44_006520 [Polyplax serrata]|uniref:Uncharacterized protein n=1 Tax=Polyplax serrata TaxID=468196 RepID=A0ABR1AIB7_POLSC
MVFQCHPSPSPSLPVVLAASGGGEAERQTELNAQKSLPKESHQTHPGTFTRVFTLSEPELSNSENDDRKRDGTEGDSNDTTKRLCPSPVPEITLMNT